MSTADFVFIESKDPIFPRFTSLLYCFERKIPGILIRERTNPEKLTRFLGIIKVPSLLWKVH